MTEAVAHSEVNLFPSSLCNLPAPAQPGFILDPLIITSSKVLFMEMIWDRNLFNQFLSFMSLHRTIMNTLLDLHCTGIEQLWGNPFAVMMELSTKYNVEMVG
jgi:hypothetical protein